MIQPISNNLNTKANLEPVKVPHYSPSFGKRAKQKETGDTFEVQKKNKTKEAKPQKMSLGESTLDLCDSVKKGTRRAVNVTCAAAKGTCEFMSAFAGSFCGDAVDFAKSKGARTITNISELV